MKLIVAMMALGLSGCMASRMNAGLNSLLGQPVEAAVDRLGYPDGQREMLGDTLYVWSSSHQAYLPTAQVSTTNGMVGGTPFYGTSTSYGMMGAQAYCSIQIAVSDGRISHYQWSGNPLGCDSYASLLRR